ncbi:MAG: hypothetical protein DLM57_03750 [Pseudonocardiales bacterium]|nr:MAG: hypothetical protein DLM57_03750 [Pseudonocardiales bacterium]
MSERLIFGVTFAGALGCALMAGLLLAFSVGVMPALNRVPTPNAITTMQSINVAILNPLFGLVFFGTTATTVVLALSAPFTWQERGAVWRLVGGLLFVVGTFVVTVACNVPLNDSLAAIDPQSAKGAAVWEHYRTAWTAWNHVRTIAGVGAAASLIRAQL